MPNQKHEGFFVEYSNLASELYTEVFLFNPADTDTYIKTLFSFATPPLPTKINLANQVGEN